jgi:hypothetical protein
MYHTLNRHDGEDQVMESPKRMSTLVIASVVGLFIGGCSVGRVVPLQPNDLAKLVGTWEGTIIYPSGVRSPGNLLIYPNGTYLTEAGAFTARGSTQLRDGRLDFVSGETTGGIALGNRTGSATLVDQGSSWGLIGSGWADAGVFNFDFSKSK